MMRQVTLTSRTFSTSSMVREVIQANGQRGSNQKSTLLMSTTNPVGADLFRGTCECGDLSGQDRNPVMSRSGHDWTTRPDPRGRAHTAGGRITACLEPTSLGMRRPPVP